MSVWFVLSVSRSAVPRFSVSTCSCVVIVRIMFGHCIRNYPHIRLHVGAVTFTCCVFRVHGDVALHDCSIGDGRRAMPSREGRRVSTRSSQERRQITIWYASAVLAQGVPEQFFPVHYFIVHSSGPSSYHEACFSSSSNFGCLRYLRLGTVRSVFKNTVNRSNLISLSGVSPNLGP